MTNSTDDDTSKDPFLSEKTYKALKQLAMIWLPALAVLYTSLAALWHFPYVLEIVGTITAVDTFLGVLLGISTKQYNNSDARFDGTLNVTQTQDGQFHALQLNAGQYESLPTKDAVVLKVRPETLPPEPLNTTDPRLLS